MKRTFFGMLIAFSLILMFAGCSKSDSAKKTETAVDSSAVNEKTNDPYADKTFPVRNENNNFVTIETEFGNMTLELYRDVAPAHADSFLARTNEGFYNGLQFFRVIDNFMIQGGDPNNNGTGNAGYFLHEEFNDLPHQDGTLSMARSNSVNSASSQFFICLARNRQTASLDSKYTVFGQLIKGFDALHKIGKVEVIANPLNPNEISKPASPVTMIKVYQSDAEGNPL